ncbi:MAG TPA: hypothetical protein VFG42_19680 [Baekduia sp.]|uniref:hypothetical protein n=1 Tax=Baekduia sp. TaxID=2600305 RepID=UPI002D795966|nr:hypothetical protein [Baekduia sp.]HET6509024.1 hypothetical protein [Baekduia sp.]
MTRILRDEDVRRAALFPETVHRLADDLRADRDAPEGAKARSIVRVEGGWLRIMSGVLPNHDLLGFKAFHMIGDTIRYLTTLYRLSTGEPLAAVDAAHLTVARTSAAAAAAAHHFWDDDPISVAVIGTGLQATDGIRALASVCRITSVTVFSPREESRRAFVETLDDELPFPIRAAASARDACAGVDMVLCGTLTRGRVALDRDDVDPQTKYISSISSTLPVQREIDGRIIADADVLIVDTEDALEESGDLLDAREHGLDHERVVLLSEYLSEPVDERPRTVYKSIGSVEQDLSIAYAALVASDGDSIGADIAEIESARVV